MNVFLKMSIYLAPLIGFVIFGRPTNAVDEITMKSRTDNQHREEKQAGEPSTADGQVESDSTNSIDWNDVEMAIGKFVKEYELRHGVTVLDHKLDEKVHTFDGSYFTSGIIQLSFTYKYKENADKTVSSSVLVKIPQLGAAYGHAKEMLYYRKERYMYEYVIPLIYNERVPFEKPTPNCYASTDSGILVLENLRHYGYEGLRKGTLLGLDSCKAVWKTLAQFHALSTLHLNQISADIKSLTYMDRSKDEWNVRMFYPLMAMLKKLVLPHCSEDLNKIFDDAVNNAHLYDTGFHPNPNGLNVLLHGDTHLSNILLREDKEQGEIRVKLIDLQVSRLGAPVIDLVYFAITSVHFEVFDAHRDELFSHYVHEFNDTLERSGVLNENPYRLEHLNADFEKYKPYLFLELCAVVPALWAGDIDVGAAAGGSNKEETALIVLLQSEKYISAFKGWAEHLV